MSGCVKTRERCISLVSCDDHVLPVLSDTYTAPSLPAISGWCYVGIDSNTLLVCVPHGDGEGSQQDARLL